MLAITLTDAQLAMYDDIRDRVEALAAQLTMPRQPRLPDEDDEFLPPVEEEDNPIGVDPIVVLAMLDKMYEDRAMTSLVKEQRK